MRRCVIILLLHLLIGSVAAKNVLTDRYNMTCLDLAAGLPHNNVNQIFADSQGFVWISTYGGGAVRYDGYSFTMPVLIATPHSDQRSEKRLTRMSSNSCKGFAEDRHHRLWVAFDEGTVVVDLRTMDCVAPFVSDKRSVISDKLTQNTVKVYCDSQGALWQVTRDSIFRYSFDEAGSVKHISCCGYRGNTPDITLCDIEQNGTVWINIENGLYRLTENGDKLVRKDVAPVMTQLQGHYVTDMMKRGNMVWIATNLGLYAYNQYDSTLSVYRHSNDEHSLSHDHATALAVMPDGRLLVGTLCGMNIFDERNGSFEHWNTATDGNPMPSDFVHSLMIRDGQIWIGTETAGVVKLSPQPLMLRNYRHEPGNARSLSPNPVNAMYVEPDGTLWVGTVEGGLNRRETGVRSQEAGDCFDHWPLTDIGLKHNTVSVLEPDAHGRLWIGTWGGGLNWIEVKGEGRKIIGERRSEVHHVVMPPEMARQTDYIGALAYDRINDALWIGSNDGIFYYNLQTGQLEDPFQGNRDIRGCIGSHVDRNGLLWMGCLSGVCIIDLHSRPSGKGDFKYRRLRNKLDHPESAVIDKISCFCETKDGELWLGSNGYGLYRRMVDDDGKETFEVLTTDHGLANNAVKGIVEDMQGRLWITTDNGLSVYDTRTRTFNNYSEHDGLLCQRFYWNSAVKGPDGAIYLGSAAGLTEVRGENTDAKYPIHLTFTRLMVDNQEITAANSDYMDADISQAAHIRLHESVKSFAIDFSTLTYAGETQGHYRYRLIGFEDDWIPLKPGEHSVRYTSPKSGNYTFEVEYITGADAETYNISIEIEVIPYFWKSWWFTMLVLILLAGIAVWLYRRRMETMRRQEAERLLMPIRRVLDESEDPEQLQQRIQTILDNHERLRISYRRSVDADKEEALRTNKSFMQRATEIMEKNYMNSEFGITEFAEAIGMSRSLVSKRLNEETGQSTGQFIRNYRLNIAKKLLLENVANRNITEIAYKVGFNDPKYFTRCFTRQYGHSPSTYTEEDG